MQKTLFGYIWRYSAPQQGMILLITVFSFPILYMSLELPKWIVNDAISSKHFPREVFGYELEQIPYLLVLCLGFLALVVANNVVKYVLNVYKGIVGERMLRRLRFQLFEQVMRFRPAHFRKVSSGELIPMITSEVEDLGGFIGDSIAVPAFQGGTLIVYIVFIFVQDPLLGAAAISLYPLQAYIIPKLRRKVILLSRERIRNVRRISDRIGESVGGILEIHSHDTSDWHKADLSNRLYENYLIRFEIYKRKYLIKFINNFMNQLPPFFFYAIGGYFVIKGEMSFGALVAVLSSYKDLSSPWNELLTYYQTMSDVAVKYETIVENFDPPDIYPAERLRLPEDASPVTGAIELASASVATGVAGQEVHDVTLSIPFGTHLAVAGEDGSGRTELLQLIAALVPPTAGRAELAGTAMTALPEAVLGASMAYVGPAPYVFNDTLRGNLLYGIRHRPVSAPPEADAVEARRRMEAERTANSPYSVEADWNDHSAAGVQDDDGLDAEMLRLIEEVHLADDVYRLGLQSTINPVHEPDLVRRLLEARAVIARRIAEDRTLSGLVHLWDMETLNPSATIAENLLFALPADASVAIDQIPRDPEVRAILAETGLEARLVSIGIELAETLIELFGQSGMDGSLVGTYSLLSEEELAVYETRVKRFRTGGQKALSEAEIRDVLGLAFRIVPARQRLTPLQGPERQKVIAARHLFRERVVDRSDRYVPFDPGIYLAPLTLEENVLFGKIRLDRRGARDRVDSFVRDALVDMGLRDPVIGAGLEFQVGVAGSRLTAGQRRRLALARALLKRPGIAVLDDVLDDPARLMPVVARRMQGRTLVVGMPRPMPLEGVEKVVVLGNGRLVASGDYDSVIETLAARSSAGPAAARPQGPENGE
ncbi:ABC transporter transmembrane domain-containing protein [Segnochrobactraceae bacterium EtOH-i3]